LAVSVRFSRTSAGSPVFLPQSAGSLAPDDSSGEMEVWITHTGTAKISACKFYILPYSAGVYLGTVTAQDDYDKVIAYGDNSYPAFSGEGLYVNMNHGGTFPAEEWQPFRTGWGDSLATAADMPIDAISSGSGLAGEIPTGGEAHIRLRLDIPATETETGTSYVDLLMVYTSTS